MGHELDKALREAITDYFNKVTTEGQQVADWNGPELVKKSAEVIWQGRYSDARKLLTELNAGRISFVVPETEKVEPETVV